jgi:hypothetical protein
MSSYDFNGMDSAGGYSTQSMAAAAAEHYRTANNLTGGDPADVQSSIAESLCGLLAMQLARYADEPHDDFDDDDYYEPPSRPIRDVQLPREESDEDHERAYQQEHGVPSHFGPSGPR